MFVFLIYNISAVVNFLLLLTIIMVLATVTRYLIEVLIRNKRQTAQGTNEKY